MTNDERVMVFGTTLLSAVERHGDDLAEFLNLAQTLSNLTMQHADQPEWVPLMMNQAERLIASGEALEKAVRQIVPIPPL